MAPVVQYTESCFLSSPNVSDWCIELDSLGHHSDSCPVK